MAVIMGMKVWTRTAQAVDKPLLYTPLRTTQMQDVSRTVVSCEHINQMTVGLQPQFPQSPTLITVISSIYIHPHIAITSSQETDHGAAL